MMLRKLASPFAHPVRTSFGLRGRGHPEGLWERYERMCRQAGIDGPHFILSMDCDTEKDIDVVPAVHSRLLEMGIMTVYAVPGELLELGADTYTRVADTGAEFLNHGYRQHTTIDASGTVYESFGFYDQMTRQQMEEDVRRGHGSVTAVTGRAPDGFRTPHFGSFQKLHELRRLHALLKDLGYRFSTSTMPFYAVRNGTMFRRFGLPEVPVTGRVRDPLAILDSWSYRFAPHRTVGPEDYEQEVSDIASMLEAGHPILINLYADPSQVHDWDGFFTSMRRLAPYALPGYSALLDGAAA